MFFIAETQAEFSFTKKLQYHTCKTLMDDPRQLLVWFFFFVWALSICCDCYVTGCSQESVEKVFCWWVGEYFSILYYNVLNMCLFIAILLKISPYTCIPGILELILIQIEFSQQIQKSWLEQASYCMKFIVDTVYWMSNP